MFKEHKATIKHDFKQNLKPLKMVAFIHSRCIKISFSSIGFKNEIFYNLLMNCDKYDIMILL